MFAHKIYMSVPIIDVEILPTDSFRKLMDFMSRSDEQMNMSSFHFWLN